MASSPTSVSKQPWPPQWQARPLGVDHHVADLAGIAPDPGHGLAADDDPAAETDLAGEIDQVLDVGGHPAYVLRQSAEVRVVADVDRHAG